MNTQDILTLVKKNTFINRDRAVAIMERENIAALIATTPENVTYVGGTVFRPNSSTMQIYAIFPKDRNKRICLILPTNRLCVISQTGFPDADIYLYSDFFLNGFPRVDYSTEDIDILYDLWKKYDSYPTPWEALTAALQDLNIGNHIVGVDEMRMDPAIYARLQKVTSIVPSYQLFREIRQIKTQEEVKYLQKAADINETAEQRILQAVVSEHPLNEAEVAARYRTSVIRNGAVPGMVAVGSGPRSAVPLIEYYKRDIQLKDLVRFDLCCQYEGYWSDTGRTVVAGQHEEWQERYFSAIYSGWEKALQLIKPGAIASDIFSETVETVKKSGIPAYRRQHVGHSIGLEIYDGIVLAPHDHHILKEGMTFCVEVPYYELGLGGFQIEDTIVVTKNGFDYLTKTDRKLF